jgi:hypothetical protein
LPIGQKSRDISQSLFGHQCGRLHRPGSDKACSVNFPGFDITRVRAPSLHHTASMPYSAAAGSRCPAPGHPRPARRPGRPTDAREPTPTQGRRGTRRPDAAPSGPGWLAGGPSACYGVYQGTRSSGCDCGAAVEYHVEAHAGGLQHHLEPGGVGATGAAQVAGAPMLSP